MMFEKKEPDLKQRLKCLFGNHDMQEVARVNRPLDLGDVIKWECVYCSNAYETNSQTGS